MRPVFFVAALLLTVRRPDRIAHVSPGRVLAVLVDEETFKHEELLASAVQVMAKARAGRVANKTCRATVLASESIEQRALHAIRRRCHRGQSIGNHNALREVGAHIGGHDLSLHRSCLRHGIA